MGSYYNAVIKIDILRPEEEFPNSFLAWSWAALVYLNLQPEVVFHPDGYKGESDWLIAAFNSGKTIGVPLLQWMGLTAEASKAEQLGWKAFPHMQRWLRE